VAQSEPAVFPNDRLERLEAAASAFTSIYCKKVEYWQQQIANFRSTGRRVVVWGAGTKGISFLNTVDAQGVIEYVIDINPKKKGMFISGAGQEIMPVEFLKAYRPDFIIVMNANYEAEIREQLQEIGVSASLIKA
jgi:threonine dehydrogenase-like Zn-dependent dehydrogenase